MNTPYDAALRLIRREVDGISAQIGQAAGELAEAELAQTLATEAVKREFSVAAGSWDLPANAYFSRMRAKRNQLELSRIKAATELDTLRTEAVERYGRLRAIEGAAETHQEEAIAAEERAQHERIDDTTGARMANVRHLAQLRRRRAS